MQNSWIQKLLLDIWIKSEVLLSGKVRLSKILAFPAVKNRQLLELILDAWCLKHACLYMISSDICYMGWFSSASPIAKPSWHGTWKWKIRGHCFCVTSVALKNSGKKQPSNPGVIIFRINHCHRWDCTSAQRPWCLKWDLRPLRCLLGCCPGGESPGMEVVNGILY